MNKSFIFLCLLAGILIGLVITAPALQVVFLTPTSVTQTLNQEAVLAPSQRFLLVGDTGSGTADQLQVATAMKEYCQLKKDCKAAFIIGDVFYETGVSSTEDPQFLTKFEQPYQKLQLPIYIAYGNHDYLGCRECYLAYATQSAIWKMPAAYYTVEFGSDLSFFVINTEDFNRQQQQWLATQLQASTAKWKVVLGHRPVQSAEVAKLGEDWAGKTELEQLLCHQADFYISGHAHALEDTGLLAKCSVRQLIVGGGGAALRDFIPNSHDLFQAKTFGFLGLSTMNQQLDLEFEDQNGHTLYSLHLIK